MRVTLGNLDIASLPDAEVLKHVSNHFQGSHVPLPNYLTLTNMLKGYRSYASAGMTSPGALTNALYANRIAVTYGSGNYTLDQAAAFVAALQRLEKGDIPGNPNEGPSWSESYSMGLGKVIDKIPWGLVMLGAGAFVLLSNVGKGIGSSLKATVTRK